MSHKEMCIDWVEERKYENDDGTFSICDPTTGEVEEKSYSEEEIDDILWARAIEVDAPTLYGINV